MVNMRPLRLHSLPRAPPMLRVWGRSGWARLVDGPDADRLWLVLFNNCYRDCAQANAQHLAALLGTWPPADRSGTWARHRSSRTRKWHRQWRYDPARSPIENHGGVP
jgi:hypothetical protein